MPPSLLQNLVRCCREGIYSAVAEATSCGVTSTVMFFPDGRRYNRQLRSYDRRWLVDFMPNKSLQSVGGPFTCVPRIFAPVPHAALSRGQHCSACKGMTFDRTKARGGVL